MSRNFLPAVMAIGMGVFTGYYTFQPALQDRLSETDKSQGDQKTGQQLSHTEKKDPPASSPSAPVNDLKTTGK